MPQVYDVIIEEHHEIERLLTQLIKGEPDTRQIEQLYRAIDAHARAEEQTLYVDLKEPEATHELVLEAVEEHHLADLLLAEIRQLDPSDELVHPKLIVLTDTVRHHLRAEEHRLFGEARKVMDDEWAEQMGQRFEQQEQQIMQSMA